jgi:hypothetical protein
MTTKEVLLGLAAAGLLAFGFTAPVYAEDPPPPPAQDDSATPVPADPDSTPGADSGDVAPDPGTGTDEGGDAAPQGDQPPPDPQPE